MLKKQLWLLLVVIGIFTCLQSVWAVPWVRINRGDYATKTRKVTIFLNGPDGVQEMRISNKVDLSDAGWETYKTEKTWYLDYGKGTKVVYVRFRGIYGETEILNAMIYLDVADKMFADFTINDGSANTVDRLVTLNLTYSEGVDSFWVSNTNNFSAATQQQPIHAASWTLTPGTGQKTVYVRFLDANNNAKVISKKVNYTQPARYIGEGATLKGQSSTVYYLGYDGKIHPFSNSAIYHSWYKDFNNLVYVSNAKLGQYSVGQPVCIRPGTWLVRFSSLPKIYAVEPGCQLRPMLSNDNAYLLYGKNWASRVLVLDPIYNSFYTVRGYDSTDVAKGIVDVDRDGVSSQPEEENGTSDNNADTDGDGLSDYEEIYYWFSDPLIQDTNKDGIKDAQEILQGFSPVGSKITSVPSGSYDYPYGSVIINKSNNKYYYRNRKSGYCLMANKPTDAKFNSNNFPALFIIDSPYQININVAKCSVANSESDIVSPTVSNNAVISLL